MVCRRAETKNHYQPNDRQDIFVYVWYKLAKEITKYGYAGAPYDASDDVVKGKTSIVHFANSGDDRCKGPYNWYEAS